MKRGPRWFHRWYAGVFHYFWLPCPVCGTYFGGHEDTRASVPKRGAPGIYNGVCSQECEDRWWAVRP